MFSLVWFIFILWVSIVWIPEAVENPSAAASDEEQIREQDFDFQHAYKIDAIIRRGTYNYEALNQEEKDLLAKDGITKEWLLEERVLDQKRDAIQHQKNSKKKSKKNDYLFEK